MNKEISYTKSVSLQHIKKLGQYFTSHNVAEFMCSWACQKADTMLDPAVGNSIFLTYAKKYNPKCILSGYEIDSEILHYFGNPAEANIINKDYLLNGWEDKYDTIVCNPPYNRFQAINNRDEILDTIYMHTGVKYSGYTNLYILFLIKSIYQLSDKGRLAYIIPSEFMNSKYGTTIKQMLIDRKLLRAIINFENDHEMFFNATTTCCILLLDYEPKSFVSFYNLTSVDELTVEIINGKFQKSIQIAYDHLKADEKWRSYINQEEKKKYTNLKPIAEYCSISRGIATGANDFFCFSLSKAKQYRIPKHCLKKCICRSADVKAPIFNSKTFEALSKADKMVYLLDVTTSDYDDIAPYVIYGEKNGINKKYLTSLRTPWYSMEQKQAAPILVSSACRDGIKFVRNVAMVKSLTTFHSVFIHNQYVDNTDIIFCYFLTPIAQTIIRENRKELGNGLEKFQPNDLNTAMMLDINLITTQDRAKILTLYGKLETESPASIIEQLNNIFSYYLLS